MTPGGAECNFSSTFSATAGATKKLHSEPNMAYNAIYDHRWRCYKDYWNITTGCIRNF